MKLLLLVKHLKYQTSCINLLFLDKSWCEYVEYILDTLDYIHLHQEDLLEFHQISNDLITSLNEKQTHFETMTDDELKSFNEDLEKFYEQVESLNQKGELLLQSSASNLNDDNENQIERLLETINRNYDSLTVKTKTNLDDTTTHIPQPTKPIKSEEEIVKKAFRIEEYKIILFFI